MKRGPQTGNSAHSFHLLFTIVDEYFPGSLVGPLNSTLPIFSSVHLNDLMTGQGMRMRWSFPLGSGGVGAICCHSVASWDWKMVWFYSYHFAGCCEPNRQHRIWVFSGLGFCQVKEKEKKTVTQKRMKTLPSKMWLKINYSQTQFTFFFWLLAETLTKVSWATNQLCFRKDGCLFIYLFIHSFSLLFSPLKSPTDKDISVLDSHKCHAEHMEKTQR